MGKILAVDYGDKRVGIAISDELMISSAPLTTLFNNDKLLTSINEIILNEKIMLVVVGLPTHYDDSPSEQTMKVKKFIKRLRKTISIPIETFNERYSSSEANEILIAQGVSSKKAKEKIDQIAASIILRNYLENREKEQ